MEIRFSIEPQGYWESPNLRKLQTTHVPNAAAVHFVDFLMTGD
jgi:hypothetical protein